MSGNVELCCFGMLLAYSLVAVPARGQENQAPPPVRKIPGITALDSHPNACVDCHVNHPEIKVDARFSTLMKEWGERVDPKLLAKAQASSPEGLVLRGKHPISENVLASIPAKCLVCHDKQTTTSPPFARLMHMIHLVGGQENHFLTVYQGECTHCHKLDVTTSQWAIPSAPEK